MGAVSLGLHMQLFVALQAFSLSILNILYIYMKEFQVENRMLCYLKIALFYSCHIHNEMNCLLYRIRKYNSLQASASLELSTIL